MVLAVDDRDPDRRLFEAASHRDAAKAGPDHHHMRCRLFRKPVTGARPLVLRMRLAAHVPFASRSRIYHRILSKAR